MFLAYQGVLLAEEEGVVAVEVAADAAGADIAIRTTTENPYVYWENMETLVREHLELGMDLTVTEKLPLGAIVTAPCDVGTTEIVQVKHQPLQWNIGSDQR